jgi:2-octaprenyl-6-methoxyphenol hydroxylase
MINRLPFDATRFASHSEAELYDIVIAGAGLAGLTMAKALASGLGRAARIAIVTRDDPNLSRGGADSRATALSAASVRMLERLEVWAECADAAEAVTAIDITDSALDAGVRPILLSYDNHAGHTEPASRIIPNAALQAALMRAVDRTPSITVISHSEIANFATEPERVSVALTSGQALQAKLLIAADGRSSPLREMAGIKTTGWSYAQTGITVTVGHDRPHNGHAVQHFLPGGPFAMLPLPGNRSCITWSERNDVARRLLALDDAAFLDELEQRAGGRLGALTLVGPRQSWPLEMFVARSFIAPRFALVGDAAHNVHPIAGQGLNLGLRDCAALAEVLVDTHRLGLDMALGGTLERYERWRRFDTTTSAASFDALNRLFSTDGPLRRAAREFGLGAINRLPALKHRLVSEAAGLTGDLPRLMRGEAI